MKKIMLFFVIMALPFYIYIGIVLGVGNKFVIEGFGIKIGQNFPNPCNLYTTIIIDASESTENAEITIKMCNINGKYIKNLSISVSQGHRISRQINLGGIAAGVYFCKIIINGRCIGVMKMLLIK